MSDPLEGPSMGMFGFQSKDNTVSTQDMMCSVLDISII
jgi:hypothetical protein